MGAESSSFGMTLLQVPDIIRDDERCKSDQNHVEHRGDAVAKLVDDQTFNEGSDQFADTERYHREQSVGRLRVQISIPESRVVCLLEDHDGHEHPDVERDTEPRHGVARVHEAHLAADRQLPGVDDRFTERALFLLFRLLILEGLRVSQAQEEEGDEEHRDSHD